MDELMPYIQDGVRWVLVALGVVVVAMILRALYRANRRKAEQAEVKAIRAKVKEWLDQGLASQAMGEKKEALKYLRDQERIYRGRGLELRKIFNEEIFELEAQIAGPDPAHDSEIKAIQRKVRDKLSDALESRSLQVKKRALDYVKKQERTNHELKLELQKVFDEEIFELQGQIDELENSAYRASEPRDERMFAAPRESAAPQLLALTASASAVSKLSLDQQRVEEEIKAQLMRAHQASQANDFDTIYQVVRTIQELMRSDHILAERYGEYVVEFEIRALILRQGKVPAPAFVRVVGLMLARIEQYPRLVQQYSDDLRARRDRVENGAGNASESIAPPASGSGPRPLQTQRQARAS